MVRVFPVEFPGSPGDQSLRLPYFSELDVEGLIFLGPSPKDFPVLRNQHISRLGRIDVVMGFRVDPVIVGNGRPGFHPLFRIRVVLPALLIKLELIYRGAIAPIHF